MKALSEPLRRQWRQSREQLAANPRLGWGLWCIVLLALLYANLVLRDKRELMTLEVYSLRQQAAELADIGEGADWPARLEQAHAALSEQGAGFGRADNEALARAEVQAGVNSLLVALGLERSRIEVSAAPAADAATGLLPLQVRVSGQARGEQLLALLGGLEQARLHYSLSDLSAQQNVRGTELAYSLLARVWFHPFGDTP